METILLLDCPFTPTAHIDVLRLISRLDFDFDIIGLSEHRILKGVSPTNNISLNGYSELIFEPIETKCGGTGIFVKDNLDCNQRKDLQIISSGNIESTFVEIIVPNEKNLLIVCLYRHPSSEISISEFINLHFEPLLHKISQENKHCFLIGDFNFNLAQADFSCITFLNSLSNHFMIPYILQPSRLQSKTLIGNIFFSYLEFKSYSGNLLYEVSDHLIQFLFIDNLLNRNTLRKVDMYKGDISQFKLNEFNELVIQGLDCHEICDLERNDPNHSLKRFLTP